MTEPRPYATPVAFRRALTDRLNEHAKIGRWSLAQLQRQIAYDRLLERLYLVDQAWVVKGAVALLARDIGVRASLDIDVYRAKARKVAEAEFRDAAAVDIGDWFRFEIGPSTAVAGTVATRLPVKAFVGAPVWAEFHVDLVGPDLRMTGQSEEVPPLARVVMPNIEQHGYRAYPLVDHVADKVAAIIERHGEQRRPSTRFRDLVDLVAIVTSAAISASEQRHAMLSEFARRGVAVPAQFAVPDRALWESGYAREAARSLLAGAGSLDDALDTVTPFLDPLLAGRDEGTWDPASHCWSE
ncbi:MAG: nucleotidyl transferase AbiEii/AbiGii toxin family protein [Acidimicrobiales bacterium]